MKKRVLGVLSSVRQALTLTTAARAADNIIDYPVTGGNIRFNKNAGTVTNCEWNVTEANIPETIEGFSVTSIGNRAFQDCGSRLTSISIPNSVTSIGGNAFWGCKSLTSVSIPNGVTSIDYFAFFGCTGLTSVSISNSVVSIGYCAFGDCNGLTDVYYDGTRAEYEIKLLPNIYSFLNCNDRFLNATFHFKEDSSPTPPSHPHGGQR